MDANVYDDTEVQNHFNVDEVQELILKVIKQTLGSASFIASKVDQWTATIIETILKTLQPQNKPFKYIDAKVTALVMQRTGAGLHSACVAHWDTGNDAFCSKPWENDTIQCVVTVFAVGT